MGDLSPAQMDALRNLATEDAHWHRYMGRFNPTPYWSLKSRRCTRQIEALIKRGFAERIPLNGYGEFRASITDAGRELLARGEER